MDQLATPKMFRSKDYLDRFCSSFSCLLAFFFFFDPRPGSRKFAVLGRRMDSLMAQSTHLQWLQSSSSSSPFKKLTTGQKVSFFSVALHFLSELCSLNQVPLPRIPFSFFCDFSQNGFVEKLQSVLACPFSPKYKGAVSHILGCCFDFKYLKHWRRFDLCSSRKKEEDAGAYQSNFLKAKGKFLFSFLFFFLSEILL